MILVIDIDNLCMAKIWQGGLDDHSVARGRGLNLSVLYIYIY